MKFTTYRKHHALGFLIGLIQDAEALPYQPGCDDNPTELETAVTDLFEKLGGLNEETLVYLSGGMDLQYMSWYWQGLRDD